MTSPSESEENFLIPEDVFANQIASEAIVSDIIEEIISHGAQILHEKYIASHIKSYAVHTLSMKLIADAVLCFQYLDSSDVITDPDDNLEIPRIDEWSAGVLPFCNPETAVIRPNIQPTRVFETPVSDVELPIEISSPAPPIKKEDVKFFSKTERRTIMENKIKTKKPSESVGFSRVFENTKKRTSSQQRNITIDSDLNIIEIQEAKNLPPPLIVPHISTKKAPVAESNPRPTQLQKVPIRKFRPEKKKIIPKLIDVDSPKFESEAVQQAFQADKIVIAPGVTIRDGNSIKSRPPLPSNVMSRAQYEEYIESLKQASTF